MKNDEPLDLTPAMQTTRVEEVEAMTERAILDYGRLRNEGRTLAARRAEHQRRERRTDRLIFGGIGLVIVALWTILFLALGWHGVAVIVAFVIIAAALASIGGGLWDNRDRIGAILSGRR